MCGATKYIYIEYHRCKSPRRNWYSPTPSPTGEGVGESQLRRLEKRLSTPPTLWRWGVGIHIFFKFEAWTLKLNREWYFWLMLLVLGPTAWIQMRITHGPLYHRCVWLLDVVAIACLNGSAVAHFCDASTKRPQPVFILSIKSSLNDFILINDNFS